MKPGRGSPLQRADINITPLVDVLLVLLVIFMVITPRTATGLDAAIPRQDFRPQGESANTPIVVSIDAARRIWINQDPVEPRELASRLRNVFRSRMNRTLFLNADPDLLFNDVALIIDRARGAGASRVGLLTEAIE